MAAEEAKLQLFLQWLQANGVDLRGCAIRYCGPDRGFGVFSTATATDNNGVVMVAPLDLAITPMRVLQDPLVGPRCRAMFEEGDVDDRFLVMLYLTVERLRPDSPWKPYLDMLPSTFGNPLWFTKDELEELKGTTLYRATLMQRKKLQALYDDKVKGLVEELLCHEGESESGRKVQFEDFLWANSIFWTRALNIPFPRSYVFPELPSGQDKSSVGLDRDSGASETNFPGETGLDEKPADILLKDSVNGNSNSVDGVTVWVEGLVPGIDFCNHGLKATATWEVDQTGSVTGVPTSMYLILADQRNTEADTEIYISYGNKGNEELLYLYGFVIDSNPDDYLMVHYPMEAFQNVPLSDSKARLLEIQLGGSGEEKQPSDKEVIAAVWETCGDYGALELLVDLLRVKLTELEDGSGTEPCDAKFLEKFRVVELQDETINKTSEDSSMSRNKLTCVVYRRGQKQLTSLFLKEAEHVLELCASEEQ